MRNKKILILFSIAMVFFLTMPSMSFAAQKKKIEKNSSMSEITISIKAAVEQIEGDIIKEKQRQERGKNIVECAKQYVGNPYVWGGNSLTHGVDCSGFTQQIFLKFDVSLPRTAAAQSTGGERVSESDMQPGDLVFYSNGSRVSHVAMYCGEGMIVHAANRRSGIKISKYNYSRPYCIKRYWNY